MQNRKSFERILFKNVYNHLIENSLVYKYHSGFLPSHSTVHHLIESIHHTCLGLENHEINCQIFYDISKAFDRVWHRSLILKLEKYGIRGDLLQCFKSYLTNRSQQVRINDSLSSPKHANDGVPQGSVLGPLLFLIYINDIADSLEGSARLFADDTSISYSSSDMHYLQLILNEALQKMHIWACKWLIIFNPLKTDVMLVSNTFIDFNLQLIMDKTMLQIVDAHRHLRGILTSNNKWNKHIDSITESASKQLSYLRKVKNRSRKTYSVNFIAPIFGHYLSTPAKSGIAVPRQMRTAWNRFNLQQHELLLAFLSLHHSLYLETGWESLAERSKKKSYRLYTKL